jgi:hypothetical protein
MAAARPMPDAAPVIKTTLSLIDKGFPYWKNRIEQYHVCWHFV